MSRSGYSDDGENYAMWRGQVRSATLGKRGQKLLREMLEALDAMPVKELIAHELVEANGQRCALGVLAEKRGLDVSDVDPEDYEHVAQVFDVAHQLSQEIVYENDEVRQRIYDEQTPNGRDETPAERWARMRAWVDSQITKGKAHV